MKTKRSIIKQLSNGSKPSNRFRSMGISILVSCHFFSALGIADPQLSLPVANLCQTPEVANTVSQWKRSTFDFLFASARTRFTPWEAYTILESTGMIENLGPIEKATFDLYREEYKSIRWSEQVPKEVEKYLIDLVVSNGALILVARAVADLFRLNSTATSVKTRLSLTNNLPYLGTFFSQFIQNLFSFCETSFRSASYSIKRLPINR